MKQTAKVFGLIETPKSTEILSFTRFWEIVQGSYSYGAAEVLFQYLMEFADDHRQNIPLDLRVLRGELLEYPNAIEACEDRCLDVSNEEEALDKLESISVLLKFNGGVVVGSF